MFETKNPTSPTDSDSFVTIFGLKMPMSTASKRLPVPIIRTRSFFFSWPSMIRR